MKSIKFLALLMTLSLSMGMVEANPAQKIKINDQENIEVYEEVIEDNEIKLAPREGEAKIPNIEKNQEYKFNEANFTFEESENPVKNNCEFKEKVNEKIAEYKENSNELTKIAIVIVTTILVFFGIKFL